MTATLAPASAPKQLAAFLDDIRTLVDHELDRRLRPPADDPGRLVEAMHYAATGPGKRLRPAILIAAAEACGGTREAALPAAAALEMLHAYTLVHDDLPAMDDDVERRGRPTVHVAFGEAIAILAGDGLLTEAFAALAELGPHAADAVRVLAQRAGRAELLRGQAIDLGFEALHARAQARAPEPAGAGAVPRTLADIERMHAAKTGALFAAAGELGAIAAGAPSVLCASLGRYGLAIGIAFQHADDRDDAELLDHAGAAAARMRELCTAARAELAPLGTRGALLDAIASWILGRA
ncbi:MAG: polyprenyl synthetase family protein [Kofleriaceae bacterium]